MAKKTILANNPLFKTVEEETETAATKGTKATTKKGRPKNEELVRNEDGGNSAQEGLTADYTRATFIIKVSALNALTDYAYTKRLSKKDALSEIIENYIKDYSANAKNEPIITDPKRK